MNTRNAERGAPQRQRGMSLVELMVGLALGLFVLAGVLSVYLSTKQTYRAGDALARIQESTRVAIDYLSNDLRMAGAYGCGAGNLYSNRAYTCSTATYNKGGLKNTLVNGATTYAYNFAQHVVGYNTSYGGSSWTPGLDSTISTASPSPLSGSDVVTVRGPERLQYTITDHTIGTTAGSGTVKARATTDFAVGDILLAADCTDAAVFQVTAISPTPSATNTELTLSHATGSGTPGNQCTELGKEYPSGQLMKVTTKTYFIATGASGRPSLYRKDGTASPVELVEGVENMQIKYGYDSDDDGIADSYKTAAEIQSGSDASGWLKVVSIHVELVVASPDDNVTTETQSYSLDGSTVTPTDSRLRQVTAFTIGVRNKLH